MDNFHQKNTVNTESRLSKSAYFALFALYVVILSVFSGAKLLVPSSYQSLYASIIALITFLIALSELTIIKKSIYGLLIFLVLPFIFASVSFVAWLLNFPYDKLDLWMSFVFWDSLILSSFLIFSICYERK